MVWRYGGWQLSQTFGIKSLHDFRENACFEDRRRRWTMDAHVTALAKKRNGIINALTRNRNSSLRKALWISKDQEDVIICSAYRPLDWF